MQERRALGKGLSSLIPMGGRNESSNKSMLEVSPEDVIPNQNQPRKLFDKNGIDELALSIAEKGILQPLLVRKIGGGKYELIAGERRLRAAKQLHLDKVPVLVKDTQDDEVLELALIENIQRQDLNPIEESLAYKELLNRYQYTQDELAKRLGKDRSTIANMLRLLKLPDEIRGQIIGGKISMGHARALINVENKELQKKIADDIIENSLSVRDVEDLIRKLKDGASSNTIPITSRLENAAQAVDYSRYEDQLKKFLKTKVKISSAGKKGKITINFYSSDEFTRLLNILMQA